MKSITVDVELCCGTDINGVVKDMIDLSNRIECDVRTRFNGIRLTAYYGHSTVEGMIAYYHTSCKEKTAREERFWNEITLDQVLKKMGCKNGKMRFPCYGAELVGEGYTRYIRYYAFRSLFDPKHECSIFLSNLFYDEAKKRFG